MRYGAAAALVVLAAGLPALALADGLQLSQQATIGGQAVPVSAVVSSQSNVVLSASKSAGATPVTFTLYASPVAPAAPEATGTVESAAGIEQAIGSVSPAAEQYTKPVFNALDSARSTAAGTLDNQLTSTKARLAPDEPGEVLGAQAMRNPAGNPGGTAMYLLNTLYFYLLTLLRFIIGSAGVFYPVFAIAFLYALWRASRLVRRPRY